GPVPRRAGVHLIFRAATYLGTICSTAVRTSFRRRAGDWIFEDTDRGTYPHRSFSVPVRGLPDGKLSDGRRFFHRPAACTSLPDRRGGVAAEAGAQVLSRKGEFCLAACAVQSFPAQ